MAKLKHPVPVVTFLMNKVGKQVIYTSYSDKTALIIMTLSSNCCTNSAQLDTDDIVKAFFFQTKTEVKKSSKSGAVQYFKPQ